MKMNINEQNFFIEIIRKIVNQEVDKKLQQVLFSYYGTVVKNNGDGTFDVSIPSQDITYPSLANKTGISLSVNDFVLIFSKGGKIGNSYIGIKCGI